jgi:enoyl-CoA hydratase/carnithine racemase
LDVELEKRADRVAVVTLNRPHVLNALDIAAKERLGAIWSELAEDDDVRAVVLCGAGDKAFCAGSDIKEIQRDGRMVATDVLLRAIPGAAAPLNKPVVCALHGHALGMGLTLALHCDLRVAQTGARLAFPEVPGGMISGVSALRLPDLVGPTKAMEYLLLGRPIPLQEALAVGFVNAVVADAKGVAYEWAAAIARAPASAVQATKRLASFRRRLTAPERELIEDMRALVEQKREFLKPRSDV